jgi:hypothetical protein
MKPAPSLDTFLDWANSGNVPKIKANQSAVRGGGKCYYSVMAFEKLLKARTCPA